MTAMATSIALKIGAHTGIGAVFPAALSDMHHQDPILTRKCLQV